METWLRRRGSRLTLKGYFESGEVRGAIARTADRLYVDLLPAEQQIAHEILLRLTELGEGTQDTRRRVTLNELVGEGRQTDGTSDVLRQLVDARLVTVDEGTAEVAHEALIREWPLLREWLAQDRDGLRLQRALTDTAGEWQVLNHDPSLLYRGARLAAAREFAFAHPHSLNAREREFVEASLDAEETETREREEQQKRELEAAQRAAQAERRRAEDQVAANRRLRRRAVILVGAVLLAVGLGVLAAFLGKQATDQAAEAQAQATAANEQKQIALSRQLSAQSTTARDNLDLSLLLALEANREADTLEARSSLLGALLDEPGLLGYIRGAAAEPSLDMGPDGKTMALGFAGPRGANGNTAGAKIEMVSLDTRAVAATDLTGLAVALSQDGHLALTGDTNGKVTLWNVDGGTRLADLPGLDGYIDWVAFGAGAKVAIADNHGLDRLTFWDVNSGQLLSSFEQARTFSIAVSADGETLARDTVDGGLQTFRVVDQKPLAQADIDFTTGPHSLAFSPDGKSLAAASGPNVTFFDAQTLMPIGDPHPSGLPGVDGIAFSPDGSLLALGGSEGTVALWDPVTGIEARQALKGHADTVYNLAFTPDGQTLVVGNRDGTVTFWDLSKSSRLARSAGDMTGPISSVANGQNGRLFGAADAAGLIRVWDATTAKQHGSDVQALTRVPGTDLDLPPAIAFSPDGRLVALSQP